MVCKRERMYVLRHILSYMPKRTCKCCSFTLDTKRNITETVESRCRTRWQKQTLSTWTLINIQGKRTKRGKCNCYILGGFDLSLSTSKGPPSHKYTSLILCLRKRVIPKTISKLTMCPSGTIYLIKNLT